MKKTLDIDEQMLRKAKAASGASTDTETVRLCTVAELVGAMLTCWPRAS